MSGSRRYRVVRCGDCGIIYPHRRRRCTRCGAEDRVFALASFEEIERARLLQSVSRKELRLPRSAGEEPARAPQWQQLFAWRFAWVPQLIARIQRR